jgi:gamma-glutamyltranspeptidase/glutathione hydrolase
VDRSARGRRFAIATPHVDATAAGLAAFDAGGNAIDAALAAATTLAVAYPHMCGVGGDLFAIVETPQAEILTVVSAGRSPAALDPEVVRGAHASTMPERGPFTVTVPGAVAGWAEVHRLGAELPWARAFEPAIVAARDGVPVAGAVARSIARNAGPFAADPGLTATVLKADGAPLAEGETLVQRALADTLQALAHEGPGALYGGELGERYARGLRAAGAPIDAADLGGHEPVVLPPLIGRYRDLDVRVSPPPSQGFVLLEILAAIERLGLRPDPLGPDARDLALLFRAASLDRDRHLADPDHMRVHPHTLLDDGHLAALADRIRTGRPEPVDGPVRTSGGTVGLAAADGTGLSVCLIQSLYSGFGAAILEPSTGIVAQNRGSGFVLDPEHPNAIGPAKTPAHTLMPVVAHRGARLAAISATRGGSAHPQISAMSLIRAFDLGLGPLEAVTAPRWLVDGMDPVGPDPFVVAEPGSIAAIGAAMRGAGFRIEELPALSDGVGHAQLLLAGADGFEAAADPRSDGGASAR